MFKIGLCSVTFRNLTVEEIIELSSEAGIDGIEWGGDIHVSPGDLKRASEVAKLTEDADLQVTSYGSYYRVGDVDANVAPFEDILATAEHLQAPMIRVWAGTLGSKEADEQYRSSVVEDARRIADLAAEKNISIHFEYHGGTLTDTKESAATLMEEVDHPNVFIYWQPAVGESVEQRIASIEKVRPWLSYVHVFHWDITDRLPFQEGIVDWEQYLEQLKTTEQTRFLLMEFVKEDCKEQFLEDVDVLKRLLNK